MSKADVSSSPLPPFKATPFLAKIPQNAMVLNERQRTQLEHLGARLRLPARKMIYREQSPATSVFMVADGIVKSYRDLPSGRRLVCSFLFTRDLFGLAEKGNYVNSVQAITPVRLYRFPMTELAALLKQDAEMQFQFLVKVTHALRESQRRAVLTARRDAAGRLAMFVGMMRNQLGADSRASAVALPMTRSDIAAFLNLSLESVSRAAAELQRRQLITFESRHLARIDDPVRFAKLVAAN